MSFTIFQTEKTPIQGVKTRRSKSRKIALFPKGLTHSFGPKMAIFRTPFFQAIQALKKCITTFQNEKTPFQAIKTRSSKSRTIDIFPKGLTHGFGSKMAIFITSFFQAIQARKMCFTILQNEKTPFQAIKKNFKKLKNCHFSKRINTWFLDKNGHFCNFFFLSKIGQENVFYDILEQKKAFLGFKNEKLKNSKIAFCQRG